MDALIAAAIHDVKNQLGALGAWLEEARREHPSPALARAQAAASQAGADLVALLAIYRESEGSLRLAVDDHDLADFCADVLAELVLPPDLAVKVVDDCGAAPAVGTWAFDAYLVKLVLLDALRNAARHARSRVVFGIARDGAGIVFSVADDGAGYPAAILRGEDGMMANAGSGLGLRFAQLIAGRHARPGGGHGRVELANADGAVFRLILP